MLQSSLAYNEHMTIYAALLRGIMPMNPNMRGERLKEVFESLGFKNVSTVIASGNVVFESGSKNTAQLEAKIEKELPLRLGFTSTTIVRSRDELLRLAKRNPFKGVKDEKPNYLIVTFFKDRQKELCTVLDLSGPRAPDFMRAIEKKHGKGITTRTWKTVNRILKRMESER
jgi:uncharacterized protein (DUF1697 family)